MSIQNSAESNILISPDKRLPDLERISAITAALMLAFVLGEFIDIPTEQIDLNFLGVLIRLTLNTQLVNAVLVSGLAITGTNWLLSSQTAAFKISEVQHWALPALSAWILSITLSAMPTGGAWWSLLILGTGFIVIVWIAEYITITPQGENFRFASSGLTALSFALFLALAINLRALQTRLIFMIPATAIPTALITARYLALKLQSQDLFDTNNRTTSFLAAATIAVIAGQLTSAIHFLPINALSFGLALIAPIYSANILLGNIVDERPKNRTIFEPLLVLLTLWISAFLLR